MKEGKDLRLTLSFIAWATRKTELTLTDRKICGRHRFGESILSLVLDVLNLRYLLDIQVEMLNKMLEFTGQF